MGSKKPFEVRVPGGNSSGVPMTAMATKHRNFLLPSERPQRAENLIAEAHERLRFCDSMSAPNSRLCISRLELSRVATTTSIRVLEVLQLFQHLKSSLLNIGGRIMIGGGVEHFAQFIGGVEVGNPGADMIELAERV